MVRSGPLTTLQDCGFTACKVVIVFLDTLLLRGSY